MDFIESVGEYIENKPSPFDMKPSDCKHCYVTSVGIAGAHYSCDCAKSNRYNSYPLIMCQKDCEFYEKNRATTEK